MASRRYAPSPEERERAENESREIQRARCVAAAAAKTAEARAWLRERGVIVEGEGVVDGLRRCSAFRESLMQTSAPSYRPTVRQQMARACPGIEVEVEF